MSKLNSPLIAAQALFWACWLAVIGGFAWLTYEVHGSSTLWFDKQPTVWVQDLDRYAWADNLFELVNQLGSLESIAAITIGMFAVLLLGGYRIEALIMVGAGGMRFVQQAFREAIERPFSWDATPDPVDRFPVGDSFPSGHFFGEVLIYGLVFVFAGRIFRIEPFVSIVRALCLFVITLGAPARMYTGAHWPSDLLGSALLALAYLLPALWLDWYIRRRGEERLRRRAADVSAGARDSQEPATLRERAADPS